MPQRNKNRLYLALYLRPGPGYHWALYRCPKRERAGAWGTRYDAKEITLDPITWAFNEEALGSARAHNVLVRVLLGKVVDDAAFEAIVRAVPVRWGEVQGWTCKAWVREALERLDAGGALAPGAVVEWERVYDTGLEYVERKKKEHRFGGGPPPKCDLDRLPTFDLVRGVESVP